MYLKQLIFISLPHTILYCCTIDVLCIVTSASQVDEPAVDEDGFIMEDIYEDVSQPLDLPPPRTVAKTVAKTVVPNETPKSDTVAPSLPPRNPNQKPNNQPELPPNLPPRPSAAKPPTPAATTTEPEPIMEEFYEDMDEVKAAYENAKLLTSTEQQSAPKTELPVPKAESGTPKKSPLLKKKEIKKEKEMKKENKKKEKDSKKKKEKEKSKTLTKSKQKSSEEATLPPRSNTFSPGAAANQDDEEYIVQELSAQDEEGYVVEEKQTEPEPIDDEIYEDVIEPPPPIETKKPPVQKPSSPLVEKPTSPPVLKPTSPPATESKVASLRAAFTSPSEDSKRTPSPSSVVSPTRSQTSSPGGVKISISSTKADTKTEPKTPSTTTSTESTSTVSKTVTTTGGSFNKQRPGVMKVSDRITKFQKRESVSDTILHQGTLYHKAPGRTRFRQEYCKVSGTLLSFYRDKGDEKSCGSLNLEECEMCIVKEQYEGRRYVFSLAAGSAIDLLSAEFQGDLNKWLGVLEPLVKKYVKEK